MNWLACATLLEQGDPDRAAALRAASPENRPALAVLWAFNLEIARAPWASSQPMIAEMRLQWWADVLAEPSPRAHEVAGPLHALIHDRGLSVPQLQAMVEARIWDVWSEPFEDAAAFDRYLADTSGSLMALSVAALGGDARAQDTAAQYGWAAGLAAYLRAVPALEARKRIPLVDGRPEAIRALARQGLARLKQARAARHTLPAVTRDALLQGWQTAPLLQQAVQNPTRIAEGTLHLSEFTKRSRLLWQAATGRF